jgi:hypothetical protein
LKQKIALRAALLVLSVAASEASLAQPVLPFYREFRPALPPYEIIAIVRSTGLDPVSRPVRRGRAYSLRALDRSGREVLVDVDARRGRILDIAPAAERRYADLPPPYGRPPGLVPDGFDADEVGPVTGSVDGEGPPATAPGSTGERNAPGRGLAVSPPAAPSAAPPLPRPRPRVAATHAPSAPGIPATAAGPKVPASTSAASPAAPPPSPATDAADKAKAAPETPTTAAGSKTPAEPPAAKPAADTGDKTKAVATSANPAWHAVEQQE